MRLIVYVVSAVVLAVMATPASAVIISPATTPKWTSNNNSEPSISDIQTLVGTSTSLSILYKQDQGAGSDSGLFASSYSTAFFNAPNDPQEATITYGSGPAITAPTYNELYLLVKDGNQIPALYVFDLDAQGWNGTEKLELVGFWPDQGAISNVVIYGGFSNTPNPPPPPAQGAVPEPATLAIWGLGLSAVGLMRVRRRKA